MFDMFKVLKTMHSLLSSFKGRKFCDILCHCRILVSLLLDIQGQIHLQIIFVTTKGEATNHYRGTPVDQAGANCLHRDQDERGGMYGSACQKPLWGPKSTSMAGLPASTDKAISLWSLNSADSVL